jgi:hypothetical protein
MIPYGKLIKFLLGVNPQKCLFITDLLSKIWIVVLSKIDYVSRPHSCHECKDHKIIPTDDKRI